MTDIFPPAGPWVYDTSLPKPSAKFNTVKDVIEFSRTEIGKGVNKESALETLYQLLLKYKILEDLDDISNNYTVVAPNSDAFEAYTGYDDLNEDQLVDFLKSHVILGSFTTANFLTFAANNTEASTLGTSKVNFSTDAQNNIYIVTRYNSGRIINPDHSARNGVIHHLESVLISIDPATVPKTKGIVFAHLQINTPSITQSSNHVVDLYDYTLNGTTQVAQYYAITGDNMRQLFYRYNEEFSMPLHDISRAILKGSKDLIKGWRHATADGAPVDNHGYNLLKEAVNFWEQDTGISSDNWSRSSYIDIARELMIADRWSDLNNCCIDNAFSYRQLLETINQTLGKYSYPQTKFAKDNKLILSVLISNGNTTTQPIELLLHFIVSEDEN